jgi:hypothetical protein
VEKTFTPQQSYKNRAEAYRLFIQAQGLPIGQTKFYNDCDRLKLINLDKKIDLASLMAYVRQELNVNPSTGQSLTQQNALEEREKDENRKVKAEADLKEYQAEDARRKMDAKWLHRDEAWAAIAGVVGSLLDALKHQFHVGAPELIHLVGESSVKCDCGEVHRVRPDLQRAPEVYEGAEAIMNRAFNEVLTAGRIEGIFDEESDQDEDEI